MGKKLIYNIIFILLSVILIIFLKSSYSMAKYDWMMILMLHKTIMEKKL